MYHHATVLTNNMVTGQNGHDHGKRVINSGQTIWNHSPNAFGKVTPTISNMYDYGTVPINTMVTSQSGHERVITFDPTIHLSNNFNNQWETFYPKPINYTKIDTNDKGVNASSATNEEKEKEPLAGIKTRCREQNHQDVNDKYQKIETEDKVPE
ncbi:unnamed protein product [Eruca vesicaria subsp. sativa]|uniref:Uncharacterized protein n=1 Tax=Eruca vesicaria subsp. sativa TaxID=29727 RepID=A0ABC8KRT5_ERUVS|nr:unnamed protein product [Eruca vesicaria subsp. sativa]